jgi:crotonobetainyl-CoA:carnitine CoA-transferase CaiB-like acyl-CoA transferase
VLDLSRIMAGPWASQILADLGADVIKIERPGVGDDTRAWGPPFLKGPDGEATRESGYFLSVNRNKRSITADLTGAEGRALVRELAAGADVVLENFKAGTLERHGLGAEALRAANPRLIYCSVTGFGQTGPRRDEPAYDFMIQAMSGLMSVTGEPDGKPGGGPQKVGVPIVDIMTGMYAAVGILAALARREATGRGDSIDIGMLDVGVAMLANQGMNHLVSGATPCRTGNAHPNIQPQDVFACADGHVAIVVGNDQQFARLCDVLAKPDLANDPRYAANAGRVAHVAELNALIESLLAARGTAEWTAALAQAGVPCAPINTVPMALADPQVIHRAMVAHVAHPSGGDIRLLASPLRFGEAGVAIRRAPPLLGEHDGAIAWEART